MRHFNFACIKKTLPTVVVLGSFCWAANAQAGITHPLPAYPLAYGVPSVKLPASPKLESTVAFKKLAGYTTWLGVRSNVKIKVKVRTRCRHRSSRPCYKYVKKIKKMRYTDRKKVKRTLEGFANTTSSVIGTNLKPSLQYAKNWPSLVRPTYKAFVARRHAAHLSYIKASYVGGTWLDESGVSYLTEVVPGHIGSGHRWVVNYHADHAMLHPTWSSSRKGKKAPLLQIDVNIARDTTACHNKYNGQISQVRTLVSKQGKHPNKNTVALLKKLIASHTSCVTKARTVTKAQIKAVGEAWRTTELVKLDKLLITETLYENGFFKIANSNLAKEIKQKQTTALTAISRTKTAQLGRRTVVYHRALAYLRRIS